MYDVEHFRPKKEAKDLNGEPPRDGYWWLAFEYTNLRLCGTVGNRKKGGWFPLHPNSQRSTHISPCEESEIAYLIDPIDIADVALLAFDEQGNVIPMPGIDEWDVKRVAESIKRLKLNKHEPLSEARRKVWRDVVGLIADFKSAKARCKGNNPAAKEKMRRVGAQLYSMTERTAELSSVARWCLQLNDPQLSKLIA